MDRKRFKKQVAFILEAGQGEEYSQADALERARQKGK